MNVKPLHLNTTCKRSHALSKLSGFDVYMKLENLQPSGSFKIRGIGHLCQKNATSGCERLVCSSGGNAGMAAAFAARQLRIPISIITPITTPEITINRLREEGAEVIVTGAAWDDANKTALELASCPGVVYVPPFDHPDIWEGHATLIEEITEKPDLIICSVGGGGLLCGIVKGLQDKRWKNVPVLAVETIGADSLFASVKANKLITLSEISSIAKTLGAKTVASQALKVTKSHPVIPCLVSDRDAVTAVARFLDDEKFLVEPSCAASLAVLYNGKLREMDLKNVNSVLVVVCGGTSVNMDLLAKWRSELNC